jgi:hypothetical protein
MKTEKLDERMRSSVLKYEETNIPDFDRNRVWRKSTGYRRIKNISAVISAAAVLVIFLSFFLTNSERENSVNKDPDLREIAAKPSSDHPAKTEDANLPKSVQRKSKTAAQLPVFPESKTAFSESAGDEQRQQDTIYPNNHPVAAMPSLPLQPVAVVSATNDVKIIFKRGKPVNGPPEQSVNIVFKKGTIPKFKDGIPDSSYYVKTFNPFKLKFEP